MEKCTINIRILLYLSIIYPFFKPYLFAKLGDLFINDFLFILSFIIIFLFYFLKFPQIKLKNVSTGLKIVVIYYILIFLSTSFNNSISSEFFIHVIVCLGFILLVNYSVGKKSEFLNFLLAANILTYIYLVLNLITIIIYPNGIPFITENINFPYHVFGNENNVIKYALIGLGFTFLYDSLKFQRIRKRSWVLVMILWITLILTWSFTAIIGLSVFTIVVLNKIGRMNIFFSYTGFLILSITLTLMLVFLKYESNLLEAILGFFGKDLTFSNRDILWINTIESIKNSPFWGYGILKPDIIYTYIGNSNGSHNYYLDTLFRGGIVSISFLLISLFYIGKKLSQTKSNLVIRIIVAVSCAHFIMWVSEPFISTEYLFFSIVFILGSNIETLTKYYLN